MEADMSSTEIDTGTCTGAGTGAGTGAPGHLFVFGLGYSARAFADGWMARGGTVSATCRGLEKRESLRAAGIDAHTSSAPRVSLRRRCFLSCR